MNFIFDPYLVLYLPLYKLDGSSFMSKDAYGHLCTVTGALWRPRGRYFDGVDDYIDCGSRTAFDFGTSGFTIEVWMLFPVSGATGYNTVVRKGMSTSAPAHCWGISREGTDTDQVKYWDSTDAGGSFNSSMLSGALSDGWHKICAVRSGATYYLYVDGNEVKRETKTAVTLTNIHAVEIGGSYRPIGTTISEVLIYNRALTPLEIQHNYLATKWKYR